MLLIIFSYQCSEPSIIGLDVQPPTDKLDVIYVDTFSVEAYTKAEEKVRTDKASHYLVGSINDPIFGKSEASFCTQIQLQSSNISFPDDVVIDSIVLSLVYSGYYGNNSKSENITLNVYEIDDDIYLDSAYYSTKVINKKTILGTKTFVPNTEDSVTIGETKYPPHARIKLDNSLASQFVEDASIYLTNNTAFVEYFKGILVEAVPFTNDGTIYYFDLLSATSKITLYYHTSENITENTFSFLINDKCARFNMFNNNYESASSDLKNQLENYGQKSEKIYLQSRAGVKVDINFPSIKNIINPYPISINKAELIFNIDKTDLSVDNYPEASRLVLVKYTEDGSYSFIADQISANFGGDYDNSNNEYKFNISKHIQNLISSTTDGEDYGLALLVSGSSTRGDRVVLNGMLSTEKPPKLKITYTIIK